MKIENFFYETCDVDFKEEYLRDQQINFDQIPYVARLGWSIDCVMFLGRFYQNSDFDGNQ